MFSNRAVVRSVQERIRCGFGRLSQAVVHVDDPYAHGWEHDDPFTPIIISQNSEATVCSGITMDEALLTGSSMDENVNEEQSIAQGDQSSRLEMAFGHDEMTTPHNIQSEATRIVAFRHVVPSEEEKMESADNTREIKTLVKTVRTESTIESSDEEEDVFAKWPQDEDEAAASSPPIMKPLEVKRNVSVTIEDFDFDHLTIYQDSVFDKDEEFCEDGEAWLVKKLKRNAPDMYWLQLTTKIADPTRLVTAMQGNTAVRNVTVYPSALKSLSKLDQKNLVDSICQLESLQNLIVFQDCGGLFVEPLIRHRPPLTRLTLYKLSFAEDMVQSRLAVLLLGLPLLEELSLEKYSGTNGTKLLSMVSKVLPSLSNLRSLTLTPARGVKMSSDGPRALFKALWGNNKVRTLSLQGSEDSIDQECISELQRALRSNTKLEVLKLTGFWKSEEDFWGRFTRECVSDIQYLLQLNKSGIRDLQLDVNADYDTLRSAILRHRDNVDYVFYLLSHNPSMLDAKLS